MTAHVLSRASGGTVTFKARDVEELVDFYLHRRIANWVVRILATTRVQPDQVTLASGAVALVAGAVVAWANEPWQLALGSALLLFSIVLDCSDGQLARLRGTTSFAGRYLDGWVDVVSTGSIFVGQLVFMVRHDVGFWVPFCAGWAAGYALKWQVHHYDHVKNVYLLNTESEEKGAEAYPSLEAIRAEYEAHRAANRRFYALLTDAFRSFTIAQRRSARALADERRARTSDERRIYRSMFRLYMRVWSFNGLGTHLFLLTLATLLAFLDARLLLFVWAFFLGPMTIVTLSLLFWRRRLEARFEAAKSHAVALRSRVEPA